MADTPQIRQLERQLTNLDSAPDADIIKKIDILNDLAWALGDIDLKRAQTLSETAYTLAASSDDAAPYLAGMAYSLRTQGYLNQRFRGPELAFPILGCQPAGFPGGTWLCDFRGRC